MLKINVKTFPIQFLNVLLKNKKEEWIDFYFINVLNKLWQFLLLKENCVKALILRTLLLVSCIIQPRSWKHHKQDIF